MTATQAPRTRLPRDLHPVAWWVWALGLAGAASFTTNPLTLLLLVAVAWLVVVARRSDHPWARSFRLYVWMGLVVIAIRVGFRLVFGGYVVGRVVLDLPEVPLPDWAAGITLLGPVTLESLLAGLYEGMRLAAMIICVGAANSLANPKRLLKTLPAALYEVGTALVVTVTIFPQLADSVQRVRAAQSLRGGPTGRVGRLRRFLVPVLEDSLARSLALAAGMDARGYGRATGDTRAQRVVTGTLLLGGLCGLSVGAYAVLDQTAPRLLAAPMVVLGCAAAVAGLVSAGRRVERSRYRPDPWRWEETAVAACGVVVLGTSWWLARELPLVANPGAAVPVMTALGLVGTLVGALPAVLAPPPRQPFVDDRTTVPAETALEPAR